jgi:hypothetical protein
MQFRLIRKNIRRTAVALVASMAAASAAHAGNWCEGGVWVDAMLGSYHINPDPNTHFEQFNPGLGVECWLNNQWALTAGGFRNSLRRPSYYGGGVWAPEFAHWGIVRIAAMGGIISGYNYGNWGLGKRVGANFIVIPPIPSDNLPFTIGFQVKVKF